MAKNNKWRNSHRKKKRENGEKWRNNVKINKKRNGKMAWRKIKRNEKRHRQWRRRNGEIVSISMGK